MSGRQRTMGPLVSVIIATYNRADYIGQAVESVLNQTYGRIETIIVDDGSTDNTRDVLRKYEGRIQYFYQENSERSRARNEGFRRSRGEYIAFLDSDDAWFSTKIEEQARVLNEKAEVGLVYVGVQFIDGQGNPYEGDLSWDEPQRKTLYEDLMTHNIVTGTTSSVMIRRQCLDKAGLFDESMNACEDLDLYRRIAAYCEFYKIDLPLLKFRVHEGNTQQNADVMAKGWEITIGKICRDTPPEFEYYKNEAIVKNLSQIASLYRQGGRFYKFFSFCAKSLMYRSSWILAPGFWMTLMRLCFNRVRSCI
ncbi:MAG: glycosyltransferase [Thermodesulfobacteriota bacterium]|nr:glycosyltransferase [Thermodesulfobacteriota bacterium]